MASHHPIWTYDGGSSHVQVEHFEYCWFAKSAETSDDRQICIRDRISWFEGILTKDNAHCRGRLLAEPNHTQELRLFLIERCALRGSHFRLKFIHHLGNREFHEVFLRRKTVKCSRIL